MAPLPHRTNQFDRPLEPHPSLLIVKSPLPAIRIPTTSPSAPPPLLPPLSSDLAPSRLPCLAHNHDRGLPPLLPPSSPPHLRLLTARRRSPSFLGVERARPHALRPVGYWIIRTDSLQRARTPHAPAPPTSSPLPPTTTTQPQSAIALPPSTCPPIPSPRTPPHLPPPSPQHPPFPSPPK